jgi:hypothetical protein
MLQQNGSPAPVVQNVVPTIGTQTPKRGKTAMTDAERQSENPFSHFERLAVPRTESALNAHRLLGNLSGRIYPTKDMTGWKQFSQPNTLTGKLDYYWVDAQGHRVVNAYTVKDVEFILGLLASAYNETAETLKHVRSANVKTKIALPT